MKRFLFFAAAATMFFAACQKTVVVYDNPDPQEISFLAVNKTATKAPVEGTTFGHANMQVSAFLAAGDGVDAGRDYFKDVTFTGAGTFTGGQYWPISAAILNFLAVAPEVTGVTTDFGTTNGASSSTTTVTGNETAQHDVMYSVARHSKTAGSAPTNVPMTFHHAYAWLDFTFKKSADAPVIKINEITVNDVACNGTLTVTVTNAASSSALLSTTQSWGTPTKTDLSVPLPAGEFTLTTAATEYAKGILLIPEAPMTSFVISYTIADQTFEYTYTPDSAVTWLPGKRYVYNISMNPSAITIKPVVEAWDDDSTDSNVIDNDKNVDIN